MGHVLHEDGPQLLIQRMESTCRNKAVLYPQPKMHLCFLTSLKPFLNIYDQNGWQCSFICWPVALSSFICLVGDTSPLSWLGLCEWGYPKQLRVSGAGGLQQTHMEPLASTRTMPKVVSHVSSTRDLEINPGLSKGEGCAIAFFTAVRLPCLFIHITGRILVKYIYICKNNKKTLCGAGTPWALPPKRSVLLIIPLSPLFPSAFLLFHLPQPRRQQMELRHLRRHTGKHWGR